MTAAPAAPVPLYPRRRLLGSASGGATSIRRGGRADVASSRPDRPGDHLRTIDWKASARASSASNRDEFIVRERFNEETPAVVIVMDRRPGMALYPSDLPWLHKPAALHEVARILVASALNHRALVAYLDFASHGFEPARPSGNRRARRRTSGAKALPTGSRRSWTTPSTRPTTRSRRRSPSSAPSRALCRSAASSSSSPTSSPRRRTSCGRRPSPAAGTSSRSSSRTRRGSRASPRSRASLSPSVMRRARHPPACGFRAARSTERRQFNESRLASRLRDFVQLGLDPIVVDDAAPERSTSRCSSGRTCRLATGRGTR